MSRKSYRQPTVVTLAIEDFAAEGKCIAHYEGKVVFVEGDAAPGDIVDIELLNLKKNRYYEARVKSIQQYSDKRTTPFCQYFGTCGGCKWQHINYADQLKFKQQQVIDHLERIGKITLPPIMPIISSAHTTYYRNKLEFTFSSLRWFTNEEVASGEQLSRNALGFHIPKRFDRILDIEQCYLQPDPSNQVRNALRAFALENGFQFYDQKQNIGFVRNMIIRTANTGDVMVIVQFGENKAEAIAQTMAFLHEQFPTITSLQYIVNTKGNDSYYDQDVILYKGKPYIEERMEDLVFRIGPKSFYQTNAEQAYQLYKVARDFAQLSGNEYVYDLYTGTGTIANFVARQAKSVVGIEYIADAIEDAKINSAINQINNTRFFAGDMRHILTDDFVAENGTPDVIITDPPRAGMDEPVVQTLLRVGAKKIVYVSCNTATQARDLALLDQKYSVEKVQPVDMFPHTHHVENVVLLTKRY